MSHHRAMQHSDHRHLAELDFFEGAMPARGMCDALRDIALLDLVEVEAGREVFALGYEQHAACAVRHGAEECVDAQDGLVVQRIALVRPVEPQYRDMAAWRTRPSTCSAAPASPSR